MNFGTEYTNNPGQAIKNLSYKQYTINVDDNKTSQELRARWLDPNQLNSKYIKILNWINNKQLINYNEIPKIELSNYLKDYIEFADFRGIDLSNLDLTKLNLTFCVFDYANLENTICKETRFQNSSLSYVNLNGSMWDNTQAGPVSMMYTSFQNGEIKNSFIIESNCTGTNFINTKIKRIDFEGSLLTNAQFTSKDIEYGNVNIERFKKRSEDSIFYD